MIIIHAPLSLERQCGTEKRALDLESDSPRSSPGFVTDALVALNLIFTLLLLLFVVVEVVVEVVVFTR